MSEPEPHPVTKEPWTCACPRLTARECMRSRTPMAFDADEPGPGDWDYEVCACGCHDWEGEDTNDD